MPDTPVTFSKEESLELRRVAASDEGTLECPRCKQELKVRRPEGAGPNPPMWEIKCGKCRRSAFTAEVAESRRPA